MKRLLIVSIAVFITGNLSAQTWSEWFRQKQTQNKYLLQQIAALQVYSDFISKGYSIAKNGLNTIQRIKHGDFNLHNNYFTSLISVNPKIKHYTKVADVIAMQISIAKQIYRASSALNKNHQFTITEVNYFKKVFKDLLTDCAKNIDDLSDLLTNRNLELKDDERIRAVDKIYEDMQDKKMFTTSFCNSASALSVQRSKEEKDINLSKKLNGIK